MFYLRIKKKTGHEKNYFGADAIDVSRDSIRTKLQEAQESS